jgi:hypothetical protein
MGETQNSLVIRPAMQSGFALIADRVDMRVPLPYEFSPNLRLSRATDEQLKNLDDLFNLGTRFVPPKHHYEHEWLGRDPGNRPITKELPRSEWRYYVVAFNPPWTDFDNFRVAATIGEPALKFFFTIYTTEAFGHGQRVGFQYDNVRATDYYQITAYDPPLVTFDEQALANLSAAYLDVCNLDQKLHEGIWRALRTFETLLRMPNYLDLVILGYFSVIEMLITHQPNDKEIGDSLMHQIRTKVDLLNSRLSDPLDYSVFPQLPTEAKVWNTLYGLRSAIAHGNHIDFNKTLKGLVDRDCARQFLQVATRRLLRHSLKEPRLVDALKPI